MSRFKVSVAVRRSKNRDSIVGVGGPGEGLQYPGTAVLGANVLLLLDDDVTVLGPHKVAQHLDCPQFRGTELTTPRLLSPQTSIILPHSHETQTLIEFHM